MDYRALMEYEAVFDLVDDVVLCTDRAGHITRVNPAFCDAFGYRCAEILGEPLDKLYAQDQPGDGDGASADHGRYFAAKAGHTFRAETASGPVRGARGETIGRVYRLRQPAQRGAALKQARELMGVLSHELRTPLTSVHGALRLLRALLDDPSAEQIDTLLRVATRNVERLRRLLDDLAASERLESKELPLRLEPIAVGDLLGEVRADHLIFAAEHGVEVVLGPLEAGACVCADHDRLYQVLTNLIANAVKFSPPGSPVVLRVDESPRPGCLRLVVEDHGAGIPAHLGDRIFEKHHRGANASSVPGRGLGLSVCRDLVERMGGSISYDSTLGVGTTFFVDLHGVEPRPFNFAQAVEPLSAHRALHSLATRAHAPPERRL